MRLTSMRLRSYEYAFTSILYSMPCSARSSGAVDELGLAGEEKNAATVAAAPEPSSVVQISTPRT